jgi:uncharacterized protein YjbI with pentapeptide repeats
MTGTGRQLESTPGRPLRVRAIVFGGVLVALVGAVSIVVLLYFYGGGTDRDRARLEVVRTAGTVVVGAGGAVALLLAARRQRSTELTLEHQRKVALAAERDATERRITELYTRAVDQLGSDKAPVRLGGLFALERLAQNNLDQRQTIVDVICAYLRMPYSPPGDQPSDEHVSSEAQVRYEQRRQELQVRLTAQRLLATHLRPDVREFFWADTHLDLIGAHLYELNVAHCHIKSAVFDGAQFSGTARFEGVHFGEAAGFDGTQFGSVMFHDAQFDGTARFPGAHFSEAAWFTGARFGKTAVFNDAQFMKLAWFSKVQFGEAVFNGAQFVGDTWFNEVRFNETAVFDGARFGGVSRFSRARFSGAVWFDGAQFHNAVEFNGARVRSDHDHSWPTGWTTRDPRLANGKEEGWMYLVRVEDPAE